MTTTFLILLISGCTQGWAQVDIEKFRGGEALTSTIGVSGGGAAGNSEYFTTGATIGLSYTSPRHAVLVLGDGLIGFAGGKSFSNDGLVHLRYTRVTHARFHPEVFGQTDYDTQRSLSFRYLAGGGIRTTLFDKTRATLYVGNSVMYEHERLDLPTTAVHPRNTSVFRSSNYVNFRIQNEDDWKFTITGYYQPDVTDFGDQRILCSTTLTNALFGPLSQTVNVRYRRDSRPPDGSKRNDVSVSFGIEWQSGK